MEDYSAVHRSMNHQLQSPTKKVTALDEYVTSSSGKIYCGSSLPLMCLYLNSVDSLCSRDTPRPPLWLSACSHLRYNCLVSSFMLPIFATPHLNFPSEGSSLWEFTVAASVKDVAAADTIGDVAAADSIKDAVVLKRISNESLPSKLEAGSVKDLVIVMLHMSPLITCFPPSSEAIDVRR